MKQIVIKRMHLENFKCFRSLDIDFNAREQKISGANGSGKSTIADAFCWLLFGKNMQGQQAEGTSGFALKTIDAATGEAISHAEHIVRAEIDIINDGTASSTVLERKLQEKWTKKRSSAEAEFEGHTTEYKIDGVPFKAKDYASYVSGICDEAKFVLFTRPDYFFSLAWKDQREMLMGMVTPPTAEYIASVHPDYNGYNLAEFLSRLNGEDVRDFRIRKAYELKQLKPEYDQIEPKIKGIQSLMPQDAADLSALRIQEDYLTDSIASLSRELNSDQVEQIRTSIADTEKQMAEASDAWTAEKRGINSDYNAKIQQNRISMDNEIDGLLSGTAELSAQITDLSSKSNLLHVSVRMADQAIRDREDLLNRMREAWKTENEKQFVETTTDGNTCICPITKLKCDSIPYVIDKAKQAKEDFEKNKKAEMQRIVDESVRVKTELANFSSQKAADIEAMNKLDTQILTLRQKLDSMQSANAKAADDIKAHYNAMNDELTAENMQHNRACDDKWQQSITEKKSALAALRNQLEIADCASGTAAKTGKIAELKAQLASTQEHISVELQAAKCREQIAALKAEGKKLGQQIASIEAEQYAADAIVKLQISETESRINALFGGDIKFRMFEQQINGGEVETCILTQNGIRYHDLNTAGKIKVGLAVINAFQKFYGTLAPVFIDNAESCTDYPQIESQVIYLTVDRNHKQINIA